jgi:prepilin-type N-terminal cleavage/methylation domain-containing protein
MHRKLKIANCKSKITSRPRGFTLTEVAVASALLVIVMVPILRGLAIAHLNTAIIEHKSRSLILAQTKLDDIKARSIYNYSNSYTATNLLLDANYPSYLCNVYDNGSSGNLRTITVSVGFDLNGSGILTSNEILVTLSTELARRWNSG